MYHTWKRNTALFVIFSIVLSLARVDATASTLFYYGNPANGTLYSLDSQGNSAPVYDTLVSLPSALTVNGTRVYFANNSPNLFPTISYVDVSPVSAPQGGFSAGVSGNATNVFVSSIRVFGSTLIFSYGGVDVSFDNVTFSNAPLICAIDINDATKNVEVLLDSTKLNGNIVTSFAVDSTSGDIYLTTNNAEFGSGGFIYSFPYPQDETTTLTQIFSTDNDISSIQIGPDNNLYFISNAVNVTMFNTLNNKTKANTFTQPLSQIEFVGNDLYIRALNGDVFLSQNTTATKVVTLPQDHVTDSSISATGNNVTVYYVGVDTSAVLSVVIPSNYTTVNASAVATGFGANSFTWVDLDSEVLYYAAYNQINALTEIDSGSPQWEHVYTTDTPIIALTGDLSTGDVLAITEHQIYHFVKSTMAVRSAQTSNTITAITVDSSSSTIYFSYASSASSTDSPVHYCTLSDCAPDTITSLTGLTPEGDIISLYVHENSQTLYYSTEKGVYSFALGGNSNDSTSVFAATPAIKPFAVLAATTGDVIYFLDVQNSTTTLFACTYPLCKSVQNLAHATGNVSKPGDTAWIAYDNSTASLFWSSSSLGSIVMSYDLTTSVSAILTTTPTAILGLSVSEGTVYVSTLDGLVSYFAANGTKTGQCALPTDHVVGAVNAFNSTTFLWADYNVATVTYCGIGCLTGCVGNGTFATANVDTVNCPHLQFITVTEEFVYNQNGCGGIMRTPLGSTEPEKLKEADTYPIAGLTVFAGSDVTNTSTSLAWALPYRYSIVNVYEDANTTEILRPHTVYTGSGSVMTSLFVTNANVISAEQMGQHTTVFWNDVTTAKLLKYEYGAVSDASLDYVVALSNFVTTPTPSPSVTPTPSATQSASASSSASPSISDSLSVYATPSGTASATGSVVASVSAAATVTPTATSTASTTTSVSATGSVSPSFVDNGSVTVSSTPSGTTTSTFSLGSSPSTTASATPSISQSYSVDYTYSTTNTGNILATMSTTEDTKLISKEEWEWIIVILFLVIICCIAPCSFYCWRKGVEKEMAMSLRLPTDDEPLLGYNDQIL